VRGFTDVRLVPRTSNRPTVLIQSGDFCVYTFCQYPAPIGMEQPVNHTFTVEERLKSRRIIGQLFAGGTAFLSYPLRVVWCYFPDNFYPMPTAKAQVMVSVPKTSSVRMIATA
jgi:hypothetical protein